MSFHQGIFFVAYGFLTLVNTTTVTKDELVGKVIIIKCYGYYNEIYIHIFVLDSSLVFFLSQFQQQQQQQHTNQLLFIFVVFGISTCKFAK